jgi:hypothetical protein
MFITINLDETYQMGKTALIKYTSIEAVYESNRIICVRINGMSFPTTYTMEDLTTRLSNLSGVV